MLQEA